MAFALIVFFSLVSKAVAWGADGHTTVAHLAEQYLSNDVRATLLADLGNCSLSYAANWNDDFDHEANGAWSLGLHFINYPGHACNFVWARDCKNDRCNPGAIVNYTRQVFDKKLSKDRRFFALKFVIHMMGDLHQPLHVSSGDDNGGNDIKLQGNHFSLHSSEWDNATNLHEQWDEGIVIQEILDIQDKENEHKGEQLPLRGSFQAAVTSGATTTTTTSYVRHYRNWKLLADELHLRLDSVWDSNKTEWQKAMVDPRDDKAFRAGLTAVAEETAALGCTYAYVNENGERVKNGDILSRNYYKRVKPIVEAQIAKGGARLAHLLNLAHQAAEDQDQASEIKILV
eukprot:TRINITY_DN27460_c0_g1_i1.p1 TRINITY_DN27460_c0_g1~~TRINITY_DN27460_c0_g1_i1.p1  ORF type:complete len:343 (-),score=65.27 TRINITY_DN27460_c0_g1_i1:252-1280(-)